MSKKKETTRPRVIVNDIENYGAMLDDIAEMWNTVDGPGVWDRSKVARKLASDEIERQQVGVAEEG